MQAFTERLQNFELQISDFILQVFYKLSETFRQVSPQLFNKLSPPQQSDSFLG
jgi:hypothetical protein